MKWYRAVMLCVLFGCTPAADFDYAGGGVGRYADWSGRWIVLNYWAEWCAPCRTEIPELNALNGETEGHGVVVVGINFDGQQGDALAALVAKMGIAFPVISVDPRTHFGYDLPSVLPTTIVINPDGEVAATLVGPQTRASLEAVLGISAS